MPDFETERLQVFELTASARVGLELTPILTPKVLAHLPPSLQVQDDGVEGWIEARLGESEPYLIQYQDTVIGVLIVVRSGLDVHIGYLFGEDYWGRGFASEMLFGLVSAAAFGSNLLGGVGRENSVSAHVLRKVGFTRDAVRSTEDTDMFILRV